MQVQFPCVVAPNHHGKRVVEPKRRTQGEPEPVLIALFHSAVDLRLVAAWRLFENGGEGSAGVLGIKINSSSQDCLMAYESSRQVETALDLQMSARLDDLREHLAKNKLLSEILAADDNSIFVAGATEKGEEEHEDQHGPGYLFRADVR